MVQTEQKCSSIKVQRLLKCCTFLLLLTLTSCVEPLYKPYNATMLKSILPVQIENLPSSADQTLRYAFLTSFNRSLSHTTDLKPYTLKIISIDVQTKPLTVNAEAFATSMVIETQMLFELYSTHPYKKVFSGRSFQTSTYFRSTERYSNFVADQHSLRLLGKQHAEDILLQLIAFLDRKGST